MKEAGRWFEYERYGRVPASNVPQMIRRATFSGGAALAMMRQTTVEQSEFDMDPAAPQQAAAPSGAETSALAPPPPAAAGSSSEEALLALLPPPVLGAPEEEPPAKKPREMAWKWWSRERLPFCTAPARECTIAPSTDAVTDTIT